MLTCELKKAMKNFPQEALDLAEKLAMVERMIHECFQSRSLMRPDNIMAVLVADKIHLSYENPLVQAAQAFQSGPVHLALQHHLTGIICTSQVCNVVSDIFWGTLRLLKRVDPKDSSDPIWDRIRALLHTFQSPRYCPAVMFFAEGVAKALILCLVASIAILYYEGGESPATSASVVVGRLIGFLVLMLFSSFVHILGRMIEKQRLFITSSFVSPIYLYIFIYILTVPSELSSTYV